MTTVAESPKEYPCVYFQPSVDTDTFHPRRTLRASEEVRQETVRQLAYHYMANLDPDLIEADWQNIVPSGVNLSSSVSMFSDPTLDQPQNSCAYDYQVFMRFCIEGAKVCQLNNPSELLANTPIELGAREIDVGVSYQTAVLGYYPIIIDDIRNPITVRCDYHIDSGPKVSTEPLTLVNRFQACSKAGYKFKVYAKGNPAGVNLELEEIKPRAESFNKYRPLPALLKKESSLECSPWHNPLSALYRITTDFLSGLSGATLSD